MKFLAMLLILTTGIQVADGRRFERWILWNVGQGLWITVRRDDECLHFDAGGERWPLKHLRRLCGGRRNRVHISHGDEDHIGGLRGLRKSVSDLCLVAPPREEVRSPRKRALFEDLPPCPPLKDSFEIPSSCERGSANAMSRVYIFRKEFLMPGDSTRKAELAWSTDPRLASVRVLALGHHGSKTSSSPELLNRLPSLRFAIASARLSRYGHPHPEITRRLHRHRLGLGVLRTEEWGHFIFEL